MITFIEALNRKLESLRGSLNTGAIGWFKVMESIKPHHIKAYKTYKIELYYVNKNVFKVFSTQHTGRMTTKTEEHTIKDSVKIDFYKQVMDMITSENFTKLAKGEIYGNEQISNSSD